MPTFFTELRTANWWWALLGLAVSALTYVGAAAALWACASGVVSFRNLMIMQVANTFAATTTPAGVGGLALSTRFLQKGGLGHAARHRGGGAAAVGAGDHPHLSADLLQRGSRRLGRSVALRADAPHVLYLIAGIALGVVGTFLFVPKLRRWLGTAVRPKLKEVGRRARSSSRASPDASA